MIAPAKPKLSPDEIRAQLEAKLKIVFAGTVRGVGHHHIVVSRAHQILSGLAPDMTAVEQADMIAEVTPRLTGESNLEKGYREALSGVVPASALKLPEGLARLETANVAARGNIEYTKYRSVRSMMKFGPLGGFVWGYDALRWSKVGEALLGPYRRRQYTLPK